MSRPTCVSRTARTASVRRTLSAADGRTSVPRVASGRDLIHRLRSPQHLLAIILLGVLVRVAAYLADRSLTLDESFIALNVERRSASGLLDRLDWNSAAPTAFLEIEKGFSAILGSSEHVLRAAPFVASLLGFLLFVKLADRVARPQAALLAILLFAGLPLAIAYAALVKPYSFDLLFVVALSAMALSALSRDGSRSLVGLAILGAIAPAFSYASIFAVAAIAVVLVITAVIENSPARRISWLLIIVGWSGLLLAWYLWHEGSTVSDLQRSFGNEYIGSSTSIRNAAGAIWIVLGISRHSAHLGTTVAVIAIAGCAVFFLAGVVELARRQWQAPAILLLPGVSAAIASAAHFYPLTPRTLLFFAPALVICLAEGFVVVLGRARPPVLRGVVLALLTIVIVSETSAAVRGLSPLRRDDGIKPVLRTLAQRERRSDVLYLGYAAQYPFAYYLRCGCAGTSVSRAVQSNLWDVAAVPGGVGQWSPAIESRSPRVVIGTFGGYSLEGFYRDFASLRKRGRVWIVLSFAHANARQALVRHLDRQGRRVASFGRGSGVDRVTLYLYVL
jgi:MFS family permease